MKNLKFENRSHLGKASNYAIDCKQNYSMNLGSGGGQQRVMEPLVDSLETQLYEQKINLSPCI